MSAASISPVRALNPIAIPLNGERTERWNTVVKVMALGVLLGHGLMFISFWVGIGVASCSLLALGYMVTIDKVTQGRTPLQSAIENQNDFKAKFLLFLGANPNSLGTSPLYYAATRQDPSLLNRLIQAGADVNSMRSGITPRQRVVYNQNIQEGITYYSSLNSDVTPLYHAVYFQNDESVAILLANGANPNIVTPGGTAYDWALRHWEFYNQDDIRDVALHDDTRTREQRKTAANRIVELLAPYVRA